MAMPKGGFLTLLLFLLCAVHWDGGLPPREKGSPTSCSQMRPNEWGSCTWKIWPHTSVPLSSSKRRSNTSPFYAAGKVLYGLKQDRDISLYGHFCYSGSRRTKGEKGVFILTRSYIPNTKLLILKQTEQEVHDYMTGQDGKTCSDLERKALFVHPFDNIPPGHSQNAYFVYEENIGDLLKGTQLIFVLLACGRHVKNAYKIEFRNNTHFLRNHFSCEDHGLIEIHLLLVVILGILSLAYRRKQESLGRANSALKEALHIGVLLFVLSNLLYLIHIFVYAFNGTGFTSLKVLSQIGEAIYDCFVVTIIFFIMCCTIDREKRREETFRTSLTYGVLKFLYLLVEMQNQEELSLYASLDSVMALPFVVYRVVIAGMIYGNCKRLLMEKTPGEEILFILLHMCLLVNGKGKLTQGKYNLWILSIPAYYFLMSKASVHFTHLYVHSLNLLILIYLVHVVSEKKYEAFESRHPYLDME
ncbi:hypothetical protein C922_04501 [Plasmodium inui San Antonio 1]|uniref:Uncharacterized protein n=1 Tax=Plasmodium inui San Antonio 1 TaxID=1237626 RepID=W7AIH8_9APIC|nr:hypothetical protein C922_04501 [Plasmodium inui San Antonio 1]EUD65101.1 hypothetical protein C922_04501 [Plasmodium inui San Antonio 1]